MSQSNMSVQELVDMIRRGELVLPEIQRHYVWKSTRVRDLLDSLYRGYPSGSILIWETDLAVPTRSMAVDQGAAAATSRRLLLLDGQQRLTSLSAVLRGEPVAVRGKSKPVDILFNLDHPEELAEATEVDDDVGENGEADDDDEFEDESQGDRLQARLRELTFVVASRALLQQQNWVRVSDVFAAESDAPLLERAGVTGFSDPRYKKYSARLQRLREVRRYPYVVNVLERNLSYEEVTEIFVRVNSLGAKLRASDLAMAQITARWNNALALFEEFQQECEETSWFTLDIGLLVRSIMVFATEQCKFRGVGKIPVTTLQRAWEDAKEGLRYAINFMRSRAEIEDELLLSSPFLLIPIAVLIRRRDNRLDEPEQRALLHWLLVANMLGRYSRGSSETLLNEDLNILFRGGTPDDLIERVRLAFGRIDVSPEDLAGKGAKSPLFSLAYLTLKGRGATDWFSGLGLSLTHQGRYHFIQWHHIFPKALLKGRDLTRSEVNEIANMAFITGNTNRRIAAKEPADYLPDIIARQGDRALVTQCVPVDPALHRVENYRGFLAQRRALLAAEMNRHLVAARDGQPVTATNVASPAARS